MALTRTLALVVLSHPACAYTTSTVDVGRGPVDVQLPDHYDPSQPHMLVVLLPGYSDDYPSYTDHFGLGAQLDAGDSRFIQLLARGKDDAFEHQYWMAWGDWCGSCGPDASPDWYSYSSDWYAYWYDNYPETADGVWERALEYCGGADSDVLYIRALVEATSAEYNVDAAKVVALGQSNGAAMAYRVGCNASDVFSAIVAIEGAPPPSSFGCTPSSPVRLLHIHGTDDTTVLYGGETGPYAYAGAVESAELYLGYNGCAETQMPDGAALANWSQATGITRMLDTSDRTAGDDTEVYHALGGGCASGPGAVELWKVVGETHSPMFNGNYVTEVLAWLEAESPPDSGGDPITTFEGQETRYWLSMEHFTTIFEQGPLVLSQLAGPAKPPPGLEKQKGAWVMATELKIAGLDSILIEAVDPTTLLAQFNATAPPTTGALTTVRLSFAGKQLKAGEHKLSVLDMTVSVSAKTDPGQKHIGRGFVEQIDIKAKGLHLRITSSKANKFADESLQVLGLHLDVEFLTFEQDMVRGALPEMWGLQPMSKETKLLLEKPAGF